MIHPLPEATLVGTSSSTPKKDERTKSGMTNETNDFQYTTMNTAATTGTVLCEDHDRSPFNNKGKLFNDNRDLMIMSLSCFYKEYPECMERIIPIINGSSRISLRLLDWFATNYSCQKNVVIMYPMGKGKVKAKKMGDPTNGTFVVNSSDEGDFPMTKTDTDCRIKKEKEKEKEKEEEKEKDEESAKDFSQYSCVQVNRSYSGELRAYTKQNFDPFRRNERILYYYGEDKCI